MHINIDGFNIFTVIEILMRGIIIFSYAYNILNFIKYRHNIYVPIQ